MESLKLKVESRSQLYYKKYKHKCTIKAKNSRGFPAPWFEHTKKDRTLLTLIRNFGYDHEEDNLIRYSSGSISFYSNDLDKVKEFHAMCPEKASQIREVELAPTGIKLFKREPPAKYRSYLRDQKIETTIRDELSEFFANNPKLKPNGPLWRFIRPENTYRFNFAWVHSGQYFDYDDPGMLTYVSLLFPRLVGKTYKLEKQQS